MILLSTSSLLWYWIHRIFDILSKSWFDWLDLSLKDINYDLWDGDYIYSLVQQFKIPVLSITAPSKWMNDKKLDIIIRIASKLNVQVVTFSPPHHTDKEDNWYYSGLPKLKNELSISICIKNVEAKFVMLLIPEYKNSSLVEIKKITWCTTLDLSVIDNTSWLDIIKAYNILDTSIKNILFSDRNWLNTWLVPWNSPWWISNLPLESLLIKLKTSNYNGFITIDVKPQELWIWEEELVLQNLDRLKKYYEKYYLN